MIEPSTRLAEILTRETIDDLTPDEAFPLLAELINLAGDLDDDIGLDRALAWSETMEARGLSLQSRAVLLYFRSNIWAARPALKKRNPWAWEQPEIQEQVLLLRRVVADDKVLSSLDPIYRAQIFTNLGNMFSTLGRIVESVEMRDRALKTIPNFGMALGTRAESLIAYAKALYRKKEQRLFLVSAARGFADAIAEDAFYEVDYPSRKADWCDQQDYWTHWLEENPLAAPTEFQIGSSESECAYRDWCAEQRLFLDPLNDLGGASLAARDQLHLPAIAPRSPRSEMLLGYLDAMQQEYASARWTLYEALTSEGAHFSDAGLRPHDTGDEPVYGLRIERMKTTYRTAYSIFDKISFFLDSYFRLKIRKVTFRKVWEKTKGTPFAAAPNWPLRGLYWLSRDLFDPDFMAVTEPAARAVADIRNHLEHKYLRVVRDDVLIVAPSVTLDPLVYVVKQRIFEERTLRLLQLARAALIYLVLAVHAEERRRNRAGIQGPRTTLPRL